MAPRLSRWFRWSWCSGLLTARGDATSPDQNKSGRASASVRRDDARSEWCEARQVKGRVQEWQWPETNDVQRRAPRACRVESQTLGIVEGGGQRNCESLDRLGRRAGSAHRRRRPGHILRRSSWRGAGILLVHPCSGGVLHHTRWSTTASGGMEQGRFGLLR